MSGVIVTDMDTGEQIEIDCADVDQLMSAIAGTAKALDQAVKNKSKSRQRQFFMGDQAKTLPLILNDDFKGADALVFMYLQNTLRYGNRIPHSQTQISAALGLSQSAVSKTFKKLKQSKVIYQDKRITEQVRYRMADSYTIKGKRELDGTKDIVEREKVNATAKSRGWAVVQGGKA